MEGKGKKKISTTLRNDPRWTKEKLPTKDNVPNNKRDAQPQKNPFAGCLFVERQLSELHTRENSTLSPFLCVSPAPPSRGLSLSRFNEGPFFRGKGTAESLRRPSFSYPFNFQLATIIRATNRSPKNSPVARDFRSARSPFCRVYLWRSVFPGS